MRRVLVALQPAVAWGDGASAILEATESQSPIARAVPKRQAAPALANRADGKSRP